MKTLIVLTILLMPVSAFAISDAAIDYCLTTSDPKGCIQFMQANSEQDRQRERQLAIQLEQARLQANALLLFGVGSAFVNGMNQNFQHFQQPYVNTPYFQYPSHTR